MLPNSIEEQPIASSKNASRPRHLSRCSICAHPQRRTIERAFVNKILTVSEIHQKFGVGHDAVYRHAHALNLLATRNRNWRAPVIPDNPAQGTTETAEAGAPEKTVLPAEKETTVYARAMIDLLLLKPDNSLVCAIEEVIEAEARDSGLPIDLAANQIHIVAALTKIRKEPDDWPRWFRNKGYELSLTNVG